MKKFYVAGAIIISTTAVHCCTGVPVDPLPLDNEPPVMYKNDKGPMKDFEESKGPVKGLKGIEDYINGPIKDLKNHMKGFKEIEGPVKGIKGIEDYIGVLEEMKSNIESLEKNLDFGPFDNKGEKDNQWIKDYMGVLEEMKSNIENLEKNLDFDPFDNTEDKDNKFPPWRR